MSAGRMRMRGLAPWGLSISLLLTLMDFVVASVCGSPVGAWGRSSGQAWAKSGGGACIVSDGQSLTRGSMLRLKGGMDEATKAARAARAAKAKEMTDKQAAEAAAVTVKDKTETAKAKTAGKAASKDDSSSDEDVAAAMSKLSVNSPAKKKEDPREGSRDSKEKQIVGLEGRARRLAEKADEAAAKQVASGPPPAAESAAKPPPRSPVANRPAVEASLKAMSADEREWATVFSDLILAAGKAPYLVPALAPAPAKATGRNTELAEALAADAAKLLERMRERVETMKQEQLPGLRECVETGEKMLAEMRAKGAAGGTPEEMAEIEEELHGVIKFLAQRQSYVERMEYWLSVSAACEAAGGSAEARARARCRGGALDRAVCMDPEDVEVRMGDGEEEVVCPGEACADLTQAFAVVKPGGRVRVSGGLQRADQTAVLGGLVRRDEGGEEAVRVEGTRGSVLGPAVVEGNVILGWGEGGTWEEVSVWGKDCSDADVPLVANEVCAMSVWGSKWTVQDCEVSCGGGVCVLAADGASLALERCRVGGGAVNLERQREVAAELRAMLRPDLADEGKEDGAEEGGEKVARARDMMREIAARGGGELKALERLLEELEQGANAQGAEAGVVALDDSTVSAKECLVSGVVGPKAGGTVSIRLGSAFVFVDASSGSLSQCHVANSAVCAHIDDDASLTLDDCTVEKLSGAAFSSGPSSGSGSKGGGASLTVTRTLLMCAPFSPSGPPMCVFTDTNKKNVLTPSEYYGFLGGVAKAKGDTISAVLAKEEAVSVQVGGSKQMMTPGSFAMSPSAARSSKKGNGKAAAERGSDSLIPS